MCETLQLNGKDLSNVLDANLTLVVVYWSRTMYRTIWRSFGVGDQFGGVLYIDHEVIDMYYERPPVYADGEARVLV